MTGPSPSTGPANGTTQATSAAERRGEVRRRRRERLVAIGLIVLWCLLLLAGTVVNSSPYWTSISPAGGEGIALPRDVDRWQWVWIWFVTITCYTVSNVFFLTVIGGMLGGLGRSIRTDVPADVPAAKRPSLGDLLIAGALQGFFAYVLIIAGFLFTVAEGGFLATSQAQYVRLAGLASVFGFVLGYEPATFRKMLGGVRDRLIHDREDGEGDRGDGASAKRDAGAEDEAEVPDAEVDGADDAAADRPHPG